MPEIRWSNPLAVALSAITRRLIVLALVLCVFCWIFSDVLFRDRNFAYRDAGHFYYPLLKLVQEEWRAGRWPLWNPYENAGMPLLAMGTSAVLYPPRIILFQWLPISFGAAYKWYILTHVLLSAAAAYLMARHWKTSEFAAGLAALCYAFGAVVMFQYCNLIFLVGAAWVPLGLVAADKSLSTGEIRWAIVLGVILSLQFLGGDPEAAYVTGGLAALYLALFDLQFAAALCTAFAFTGVVNVGYINAAIKYVQNGKLRISAMQQRDFIVYVLPLVGLLALAVFLIRRPTNPADSIAGTKALRRRRRTCLAVAAVVAVGLAAMQWIPTWEFSRLTLRAAGEFHLEPYNFWIAPWRLGELVWPNLSGLQFPRSSRWIEIFYNADRIWEPSLYCGALPVLLALAACGLRRAELWQRWLTITLLISLWGAMGPAGGPSWYFAKKPAPVVSAGPDQPGAARDAKAAPANSQPRLREDMETPGGGLYWLMVQVLPGFSGFRYPAKLMTFVTVALAGLAAIGWDRLFGNSQSRRAILFLGALCVVSIIGVAVSAIAWNQIVDYFGRTVSPVIGLYYGPLQANDAMRCIFLAFISTTLFLGLTLAAIKLGKRRLAPDVLAAIVLLLVAIDLCLANRWMVSTAPQAARDKTPQIVEILREAEASNAAGRAGPEQPYRVHRVSVWSPFTWSKESSPNRHEDVFRWERDTIQPKYGVPFGTSYTINEGTLEMFDYWFFFAPFTRPTPPHLAKLLDGMGHPPAPKYVYYPRRGYDMWGAKYFIIPKLLLADQEHHGWLAFLPNTEPVASSPIEQDDFQVLRNTAAYPRAWIVHQWSLRQPIRGMDRLDRQNIMEEILYQGDEFWFDPGREPAKRDPRRTAWVEVELKDAARIQSFQAPQADSSGDRCEIVRYEPDRVELDVETADRGLLILADVLFPGWTAAVDGRPESIIRTNRMMRGVPLPPGKHRVVFDYDPMTFRIGGVISLATAAILGFVGVAWMLRRRSIAQASDARVQAESRGDGLASC